MSFEDPFASAPVDDSPAEEAQVEVASTPSVKTAAKPSSDGKVVVTLKGGRDYDAPWIVIHADSAEDALSQLDDPMKKLMEVSQNAAKHFSVLGGGKPASGGGGKPASGGGGKPASGGGGGQSSAPQQAQEAPGGEERFCSHGKMVFKSGVSRQGKAYKLFSCTAPRESQCKAQFLN